MPELTEREYQIGLFDELICRGAGTVHVVSGPNPHLVVVGPEDLVDRVVVRYRGTRLVISFRVGPNPMPFLQGRQAQVRTVVVTDAVSRIVLQGAAGIVLGESPQAPLTTESVRLVNSGHGLITGHLSAFKVDARIRGTGNMQLAGDARELGVRVSGIGSIDCEELVCGTARVSVTGVGSCRVMVLDTLTASVSGAGGVTYSGTAKLIRRGGSAGRIQYREP